MRSNVPVSLFNQACVYFGVILSAEEVQKLTSPDGTINYVEISKSMGLHRKGLDFIQGQNPLNKINKTELEKVFQQNKVPVKEMRMSRR